MTMAKGLLLVYLVIALVTLAWMFRYDVVPGSSGIVYVTDRWRGLIYRCYYSIDNIDVCSGNPFEWNKPRGQEANVNQ
jgi:hypothetical protein